MPKQGFGFQHIPKYPKSLQFIGRLQDLTSNSIVNTLNYESSEICSILTTYTTAYHSYPQLIFVQCTRTLPMPFCCFLFRFSIPRPMTLRSIPAGRGLRGKKIGEPLWDGCKLETAGLQELYRLGSFKSYPVNSVNFNETSICYHLKPSFKESHIFVAQILTYPIWWTHTDHIRIIWWTEFARFLDFPRQPGFWGTQVEPKEDMYQSWMLLDGSILVMWTYNIISICITV